MPLASYVAVGNWLRRAVHHPDAFSLPCLTLSGMPGESQQMGRVLRAKERKREKTRENQRMGKTPESRRIMISLADYNKSACGISTPHLYLLLN
jgi:hypothetical protein